MANPIPCDNTEAHPDPNEPVLAVMLMTNVEEGSGFSLCGPCFTEFCTAIARQAETQAPAPVEATDDTGDDTDEDADEDAVARLGSVESADYDDDGPTLTVDFENEKADEVVIAAINRQPKVIRRGTSRSRKAFEARKRQKGTPADGVDSQAAASDSGHPADVHG